MIASLFEKFLLTAILLVALVVFLAITVFLANVVVRFIKERRA